ncbi:MAG: tetratricopeptide repeat protein, partial [Gammaproteobacteria bacterium]|nr:tetratricopeptide repeat protein [Gammaproteobacteria bacterium]
ESADFYRRALAIKPDDAETHRSLSGVLIELNDLDAAETHCRRLLEIDPLDCGALTNLGLVFKKRQQPEEAVACFRQALEVRPEFVAAHINLGTVLLVLGQFDAALAAYQRALDIAPDSAIAHSNYASVLQRLDQTDQAEVRYRQALDLDPDLVIAHNNLGLICRDTRRFDASLEHFERALAIEPSYAEAHANLGSVLKDIGRIDAGLDHLRRAITLDESCLVAHDILLFTQNYLAEQPQDELLADARCFGEVAQRQARPYHSWSNEPDAHRRLRVGLVSGDLGNHPVGYFLEGVLDALSTQAGDHLEFHAYSQRIGEDQTSQRLRACCASWVSTVGLTDEMMARRIRDDGIDILIDLAGHSANNRLSVFAWKPAPVQVSWLGYFATTGVVAMDYFIADSWTLPPEQEPYFTEQVWRLPETRLCFTPPRDAVQVNDLPALSRDYVTFGCFNNLSKMNDAVVALWARVLQAVPGSRLFLKYAQLAEASVRQLTCERFAVHGIAPERLIFEDYQARINYLSAYHRVDIALDPFPFPGGTTTVEALWMGVPVLTLTGERFLARQGVGLLMNAGLPEWVARDADDYVARAVAHASDLPALAALRARLRAQVLASPIFDAPRFARHFEHALRQMWVKWCDSGSSKRSPH